jgi:hypothetical protein
MEDPAATDHPGCCGGNAFSAAGETPVGGLGIHVVRKLMSLPMKGRTTKSPDHQKEDVGVLDHGH